MSKRGNGQAVSGRSVFTILSIFLTSALFCLIHYESTHAATTASLGIVGEAKIETDFLNSSKLEYSKTVDINVNTNSPFGYKLLFSSDADDTALVSSDAKNTFSIPSVGGSNSKLSEDMHNQYGYNLEAVDNKIYNYIPALSSPVQIKRVKTELTAADHVKFNLGFQLESSAKPGKYHRNLIFTLLAEDQAAVELVSGVEINKAIKKAMGVTDASYLDDPLNTVPEDTWPDLNITVGRNKCSDITPERTAIISVPDSDAEVYLGSYRLGWDRLCIWSNATELIFPEDLSYMYAGLSNAYNYVNFNFTDGRNKSTLNFKKVKNLDHLFHNSIAYASRTLDASYFFEYLKDSPIESAESLFENSWVGTVDKAANIVNHAKNLANAFRNTKSLSGINYNDWTIGEAENTQSMFEGSGLSQVILNNATVAKTKNTANMFKDTQGSAAIQLPNAIFGEATDTHAMFMNTASPKIILPKATFAKSADASSMFEKIPFYEFNLSNATFAETTNFSNFFKESGYESTPIILKLPKLSFASAETLSQMFYKSNFEKINLNPTPMGGSHIINMSGMFQDCTYLTEIDLHNISTGPLEDITYMFKNLPQVLKIVLPNVFNTASVTDFSSFLADNMRLTTLENSDKIKLTSATDTNHMFANTLSLDLKDFINQIKSENVTDASYMFYRTTSSQNTVIPATFKTHHISNMKDMFGGFKVPLLDISNMKFDSVTTMEEMFIGLEPRDISLDDNKYSAKQIIWPNHTVEAPYLTSLRSLYRDNHYLDQAVFPKMNTPSLTDLGYMFSGLGQYITRIDLTGLDTSRVENIERMFYFNGIDFAPVKIAFDTSNVKNMQSMFNNVWTQDEHIDLTGLNVSNVVNMSDLFTESKWLEVIDLTGWDTRNVEDMSRMFSWTERLNTIYASDSFVTTKVTKHEDIFGRCYAQGALGTYAYYGGIEYARIDAPGKPGAFTKKP